METAGVEDEPGMESGQKMVAAGVEKEHGMEPGETEQEGGRELIVALSGWVIYSLKRDGSIVALLVSLLLSV